MLQFFVARQDREVDAFSFQGARPNASSTDVCGEGLCRKQLQRSIDRGMFYVFADKIGTVFGSDAHGFAACLLRLSFPWNDKLFKSTFRVELLCLRSI